MTKTPDVKASPLDLEVTEVERKRSPGCSSSSTSPHCTCPVYFPDEGPKK
jgi:hypothetical protein